MANSDEILHQLTTLWYAVANCDHHKDCDCHWVIEKVWSYGDQPKYRVKHRGYLYENVDIVCATEEVAERTLIQELIKALLGEFELSTDPDLASDPSKEAVARWRPVFDGLVARFGLALPQAEVFEVA